MENPHPADHVQPEHHPDDLRHYVRDDVVYRAGEPGHTMFVVVHGQVQIRVEERVVEVIQPGGIFGELGVIDPGARANTAVAALSSAVLEIDENDFLKLVQTTPFFALKLLRLLVARLKKAQDAHP